MKIKRKTRKLIKELKKMESGVFKFSDGKAIYYSLDEYLESLYKEIARLNEIIDRARRFLYLTCYYNERTLTFSECNKLYNMLDKEELKEEGKE